MDLGDSYLYESYEEMVRRERISGKQICIIEMLRLKEDSSFCKYHFADEFARWLKISVEELKGIMEGCNQFEEGKICLDAANEYAKIENKVSYTIYEFFYITYGNTYLRLIASLDIHKLENWLNEIEKTYVKKRVQYKGEFICIKGLKDVMEYYVDYYLEKVNSLLEKGFGLGVIAEMMRNVLDEGEIRRLMRLRGYTNI